MRFAGGSITGRDTVRTLVGGSMSEAILRRFARDQWVRLHGTPRVTVLIGGARASAMWQRWLKVAALEGMLVDGEISVAVQEAAGRAAVSPAMPIAVACSPAALRTWRAGRRDRLAAMVDEGSVEIPDVLPDEGEIVGTGASAEGPTVASSASAIGPAPASTTSHAPGAVTPGRRHRSHVIDARSAAEAALFEALEATPSTAGRFELNEYLSVFFGSGAAEVDLLSREDRIALEVDGYYHFADLDAYRRDREKDLLLQLQGFVVIRVLAQDVVKDARPAVNAVSRVLALRGGERS
jgi:very-short-patch-repair endonuclease